MGQESVAFTLRPAVPGDAVALAPLAAQTFLDGWADVIGTDVARAYVSESLSAERLAAEMADPSQFIVLAVGADGVMLGYAKLDGRRTPPECVVGLPSPALLQRLYVGRESRGAGVADALLVAVEAEAARRGFRSLYLETDPRNGRAWRFYERRGFLQCGRVVYPLPGGSNGNVRVLVRALQGKERLAGDDGRR